jgi:hypothetical protein
MIKHEGGKYVLYARDGKKKLGEFETKEAAEKRERQVRYFKAKETISADSLEGRADIVRAAWYSMQPDDEPLCWYIEDVFDDAIIVRNGTTFYRVAYTLDSEAITFEDPAEVKVEYQEAGEVCGFGRALEESGAVWEVRVLKFGRSQNGWFWDEASGQALLPHLTNAPVGVYVYQNGATAHANEEAVLAAKGAVTRNVVGDVQNPRIGADGVYADLHLHEDAGWLKTKLLDLARRGVVDKVLGLSVDTLAGYVPVQLREGAAKAIKEIKRLFSVDIVTAPSADGRFIRATAGPLLIPEEGEVMKRDELIALIREHRPQLLEGKVVETLTEDQLKALVREALKPVVVKEAAPAEMPEWAKKLEREMAEQATQARVKEALAGTKLPEPIKAKVTAQFAGRAAEAKEIADVVKAEVEAWGKVAESGDLKGFGDAARVVVAPRDKVQAALDALFDATPTKIAKALESSHFTPQTLARIQEDLKPQAEAAKDPGLRFRSIKDFYAYVTGDTDVTGRAPKGQRVSEAALLSTDWADILGNTLYRSMLMRYAEVQYNERTISRFGSAVDFRNREKVIMGYFADLATVAQDAAYVDVTNVTDDKVSYAVTKRGNLLSITLETIKNDDLRAIQEMVDRLGRAARRTLAQFIWTFWNGAGATYDVDAVAWFNAAHGNTGTVALTADATGAAEVFAKIVQLFDQTEPGSAKKLGPSPLSSLWLDVPSALWSVARRLNIAREFGAGTTNQVFGLFGDPDAPNGGERINVGVLFTDVTDWGIHIEPASGGRESTQVDFLDGREEPELLLADLPTQGTLFTNDRVQYKIRHIYGGDLVDFRGACKNVVVG